MIQQLRPIRKMARTLYATDWLTRLIKSTIYQKTARHVAVADILIFRHFNVFTSAPDIAYYNYRLYLLFMVDKWQMAHCCARLFYSESPTAFCYNNWRRPLK